jgi:hypothetical protein
MQSAGDVLKGLGLVSKQLSQFWVASVGSSSSVTLDMFKLFCKYCSVFENQLPMTAENFARPSKPIVFKNNAETQKVGETAVRDHMQSLQSQPQAAPTRNMPSTMINPDPYSPNPNNVPTPKPYQPPQSNMGGFQEDITARPQMNSMGYSQQQSTKPSEPSTRPGVNIFEQNPNGFLSRTGSNDTSFTSTTSGDRQDMGQNSYPRPSQPQGQANPLSSNTGSDPYKITIAEFQELVLLIDGIRNQEPGFYTKVDLKDALIGSKAPRANLKTAWEMFDTPAQNKIKREGTLLFIFSRYFDDLATEAQRSRH